MTRAATEIEKDIEGEWTEHGLSDRYRRLSQEYWSTLEFQEQRRAEFEGGAPGKMDPEVVGVVDALNTAGYTTIGSCAGHKGNKGFISFIDFPSGSRASKEVVGMIREYGFTGVRFKRRPATGTWTGLGPAEATFEGVG